MKKKIKKKLELSKETLRDLGATSLVVGRGDSPYTFDFCGTASCEWSCQCQSNEWICIEPQTRNC